MDYYSQTITAGKIFYDTSCDYYEKLHSVLQRINLFWVPINC